MLTNNSGEDFNINIDPKKVYVNKKGESFYQDDYVGELLHIFNLIGFRQDLFDTNSKLHQFLLRFEFTSNTIKSWVEGKKEQAIPSKAVGLIQFHEATVNSNPHASALMVAFIVKDFDKRAKEAVNWKHIKDVSYTEQAQLLMDDGKVYKPACYKAILNFNWKLLYGYELFEREFSGEGKALYIMFIKGLGEDFQKIYDNEKNPRIKNKRYRKHTFTTIIHGDEDFDKVVKDRAIQINNIMARVINEYNISHLIKINALNLEKERIKARYKMHRLIENELSDMQYVYNAVINNYQKSLLS